MESREILRRLCRRHGLDPASMQRLLPLVRRAAKASAAVRRNLLEVVDATLAREALEVRRREELEQRWLVAIASRLHAWPDG